MSLIWDYNQLTSIKRISHLLSSCTFVGHLDPGLDVYMGLLVTVSDANPLSVAKYLFQVAMLCCHARRRRTCQCLQDTTASMAGNSGLGLPVAQKLICQHTVASCKHPCTMSITQVFSNTASVQPTVVFSSNDSLSRCAIDLQKNAWTLSPSSSTQSHLLQSALLPSALISPPAPSNTGFNSFDSAGLQEHQTAR